MSDTHIEGGEAVIPAATAAPVLHVDRCRQLIAAVRTWDYMSMFHLPVSDVDVPGYSEAITDPMDLSTIDDRLSKTGPTAEGTGDEDNAAYQCDTDVVNDLDLMVRNALKFNDAGSAWYAHAKALKKQLPKMIADAGLEIDEDELVYVGEGRRDEGKDSIKTLLKDEKKEVVRDVLKGMQDDMKVSDEDLKKLYGDPKKRADGKASVTGGKRAREQERNSASSSSSGGDDDSESGSSDASDDSSEMSTDGSSSSTSSSD